MDDESDMTILHVVKYEGSPLKIEKRWSEARGNEDKKEDKEPKWWDMMKYGNVITITNVENVLADPRLMKLLNKECIH